MHAMIVNQCCAIVSVFIFATHMGKYDEEIMNLIKRKSNNAVDSHITMANSQ